MKTTYADLAEAAGKLGRAAKYLFDTYGGSEAIAIGTLMGLAFVIRPQKVEVY